MRKKRKRRSDSEINNKGIIIMILIIAVCMLACLIVLIFINAGRSKERETEESVPITSEEIENEIKEIEGKEPILEELEVHYINIGHGDATLIRYKDYVVMIDVGSAERRFDLVNYLEGEGLDHIDYLILTHAHEDHIGNGVDLLMNFQYDKNLKDRIDIETKNVVHDMKLEEEHATNFLEVLKNTEISTIIPKSGDTIEMEDLKLEFVMATDVGIEKTGDSIEDTNNSSLGILVSFKERQFLFYGDGGGIYEEKLLQRMGDKKIDVLKVAHHGGSEASSEVVLKSLEPQYAIASSTSQELYGFPTNEVLTRYALMQIPVFCTNSIGNIVCKSDGNYINFYMELKIE